VNAVFFGKLKFIYALSEERLAQNSRKTSYELKDGVSIIGHLSPEYFLRIETVFQEIPGGFALHSGVRGKPLDGGEGAIEGQALSEVRCGGPLTGRIHAGDEGTLKSVY
jgi:hypothetical protein